VFIINEESEEEEKVIKCVKHNKKPEINPS
jgi:hypothetical protein